MKKVLSFVLLFVFLFTITACDRQNESQAETNPNLTRFALNAQAKGVIETVDNIQNVSVVSKDPLVLKAEYNAGFVQGKLQGQTIISARDNAWDLMYLLDPSHSFPKLLPPTELEKEVAGKALKDNFSYTLSYIKKLSDPIIKDQLSRQVFRLLGIYHGYIQEEPADLDFSGSFLPELDFFTESELRLGYETKELSFLDVYFLNAFSDLCDYLEFNNDELDQSNLSKCSAFVTRLEDEIIIAHNSWSGFLSQTMTMSLVVNNDIMVFNAITPGIITSNTDFGYNNKGIMFTETTHNATFSQAKLNSLWSFWRSSMAEQFSSSITEFHDFIAMDLSGTYMNGYMVVDAKTDEIALIEISQQSVVLFVPGNENPLIKTIPEDASKAYDTDLLSTDYILGVNYPVSMQIREDLKAIENRPARRRQFREKIAQAIDLSSAKDLITYTDPQNPLSIFGRWDLGYGETPKPKIIPDGAIDAKVASSKDALKCMKLKGELDEKTTNKGFWMKYGTAHIAGEPFIWSKSLWKDQKLRSVPDRVDGDFHLINTYIK